MKYIFLFLLIVLSTCSYPFEADSTSSMGKLHIEGLLNGKPGFASLLNNDTLSVSSILIRDNKPLDPFDVKLNYTLLGSLGAAYLGSGIVIHNYIWSEYQQKEEKFYFSNDYWSKLSNFNKFSHFYSVNLIGHLFSGAYEASGMQALASTWYSSLSALAYVTYLETENGFHGNNSFSASNISADILGTAFYIGQYYVPEMKNFMPKISYRPTAAFRSHERIIFDDYAGQKYWMSVRIKNYLPEEASRFWPSFIMLAAGAGLKDAGNSRAPMELYFALDLDAEKLPLYGPFWQFVKNTLNYIHFPMPGLRVTPDMAFFMFCF